jgi:amino acid permease
MMLPALFPVMDDGNSSSNMSIIFSCWNTMVGSAVVALPYSFQETGIVFGVIISFVSFITSYYTCALIIETAKKD